MTIGAVRYDRLPEHMRDGARLWIEQGICTGSFLRAVLRNDLVEAFACADDVNMACMRDWAMWLWNDIPGNAWRTENLAAWAEARRAERKEAAGVVVETLDETKEG